MKNLILVSVLLLCLSSHAQVQHCITVIDSSKGKDTMSLVKKKGPLERGEFRWKIQAYKVYRETKTVCDNYEVYAVKPQCTGNATRQESWIDTTAIDSSYFNRVTTVVIRMKASDLQHSMYGEIDTGYLSSWLRWGERMNANGYHIGFKLRVIFGTCVPDDVKANVGSFAYSGVGYEDVAGLAEMDSICVKWWQPLYLNYFSVFVHKLTAIYERRSILKQFDLAATSISTAEWDVRAVANNAGGATRKVQVIAAGYTMALDSVAMIRCMDTLRKYIVFSNAGLTFTPVEIINSYTRVSSDLSKTYYFVNYFCNLFGSHAVIGNNGLGGGGWETGGINRVLADYFKQMDSTYGSRIYYQTAAPSKFIYSRDSVIHLGISYGAKLIELPETQVKILRNFTLEQLQGYKDEMEE